MILDQQTVFERLCYSYKIDDTTTIHDHPLKRHAHALPTARFIGGERRRQFKRREGRLSCTEATPRRTLQTWIMGFGAAQKKERDAAQTAITRNPGRRLCSTGVQANRPADLW